MSASDDNIIIQKQANASGKQKRFIKKRRFYGDTSSNEDETKKKRITMPSNYIVSAEKEYISESCSQPVTMSAHEAILSTNQVSSHFDEMFDNCANAPVEDNTSSDFSDKSCNNEELQYNSTRNPMPKIDKSKSVKENVNNETEHLENQIDLEAGRLENQVDLEAEHLENEVDLEEEHLENHVDVEAGYLENHADLKEHASCCEKCRRVNVTKFATFERKLNRIIHLLENQRELQNEIIQDEDLSVLPEFPLTTVKQIEDFNKHLENADVRKQFIQIISRVGGETTSKNVRKHNGTNYWLRGCTGLHMDGTEKKTVFITV